MSRTDPSGDPYDAGMEVRRAVLANLGGIDVNVDHLGVRREGGEATRHAIIEPNAERDQQIRLSEGHVRRIGS